MKRSKKILSCIPIFIFMFIFFAVIHPMVIYHTDDWSYISASRPGYPYWGGWNPARIFPEVAMPACASIAAFVVTPITNDYIGAMASVFSLFCAIITSIYIFQVQTFLDKKFELTDNVIVLLSYIFFVFHFLVLRSAESNNDYMLGARDVTCFFYYTIPSLYCASLVFVFENYEIDKWLFESKDYLKKGIVVFLLYIGIFSNLFSSIVIAVYAGFKFVNSICNFIFKRTSDSVCQSNGIIIWGVILLAWGISLVFEANGGRAGSFSNVVFSAELHKSIEILYNLLHKLNKWFVLFSAIFLGSGTVALFINKNKQSHKTFLNAVCMLAFCFFFSLVYLVLVASKVNSGYIVRSEVLLAAFFWLFDIIIIALAYACQNYQKITLVLPLCFFVMICAANTQSNTFKEPNSENLDPNVCKAVDYYIIEQMKEADVRGDSEVVIIVPVSDSEDNFPFAVSAASVISRSLYKHGIISNSLDVRFQPDSAVNELFNLNRK